MKSTLRQNYINCRNIFDKTLHKAERDFNNKTIDDIETSCTTNPMAFWKFMANLGPRVKKDIPIVKLNSNFTDWVPTECGVSQGHSLSSTLIAIFINDLQVKQLDIGIDLENGNICILLFADDIVILVRMK